MRDEAEGVGCEVVDEDEWLRMHDGDGFMTMIQMEVARLFLIVINSRSNAIPTRPPRSHIMAQRLHV